MSKVDPAAAMAKLLQSLIDKAMADIHCGTPCKVIKFDEGTCTADVQPLIRTTSDDPAMILNVQALGHRYKVDGVEKEYKPSLHPGDVVMVQFADNEIRNAMTGSVASPDTARTHDRNDAVIVGVFGCSLSS
ncbi:hypothetical protein HUB98_26530 [Paenibacillus barcinonensis]|uniref:Phage protein Gp138 N-terminal domain-containing protein n=1 Tax=Paenibacillus barcinonensis TaxID=198119 RepID=A0A2V4WJF2_PAEBA|nr:Gp138 family membrane-puncturing spike protein [Paenibacillus barcinonensis]PYE52488.1 hypothetical protein DFQ00_101426 [Paenibacillus barcinonensis]QKS59350.1 hypothetical protein HUB98_26200 [Paenibacillus barcinonensis]QKS59408.1 hypothetical protein HUB98_26530 [Paenibacillus barcinonensis]